MLISRNCNHFDKISNFPNRVKTEIMSTTLYFITIYISCIHNKTLDYAPSNNISFVIVPSAILFLQSTKITIMERASVRINDKSISGLCIFGGVLQYHFPREKIQCLFRFNFFLKYFNFHKVQIMLVFALSFLHLKDKLHRSIPRKYEEK